MLPYQLWLCDSWKGNILAYLVFNFRPKEQVWITYVVTCIHVKAILRKQVKRIVLRKISSLKKCSKEAGLTGACKKVQSLDSVWDFDVGLHVIKAVNKIRSSFRIYL